VSTETGGKGLLAVSWQYLQVAWGTSSAPVKSVWPTGALPGWAHTVSPAREGPHCTHTGWLARTCGPTRTVAGHTAVVGPQICRRSTGAHTGWAGAAFLPCLLLHLATNSFVSCCGPEEVSWVAGAAATGGWCRSPLPAQAPIDPGRSTMKTTGTIMVFLLPLPPRGVLAPERHC
jgi:hypothetical protein